MAQQKYEYYLRSKGPKLKIGNDYELKDYIEKSIKKHKKSPEIIAKEIKKVNFKTVMCVRTIRNNIYSGDIYDIKAKDMIYNKKYKEQKNKIICKKFLQKKAFNIDLKKQIEEKYMDIGKEIWQLELKNEDQYYLL